MKADPSNYRKAAHTQLASGRWSTFTLAEQLGNVASEEGRTFKNLRNQNQQYLTPAFGRALELLDLTIIDTRWNLSRKRELLRTREEFCNAGATVEIKTAKLIES